MPQTAASWATWVRAGCRERGAAFVNRELHLLTFASSRDEPAPRGRQGRLAGPGSEGRVFKGAGPGVPCSSDLVSASGSWSPAGRVILVTSEPETHRSAAHPGEDAGVCVVIARFRGEPRKCPRGTTRRAALARAPGGSWTVFQAPCGKVVRRVVRMQRIHPGIQSRRSMCPCRTV